MPVTLDTEEAKIVGWQSRRPQAKTQDPVLKITKAKTSESMAQVVEHLPSNLKALSSNPVTKENYFPFWK
jgi:hypothetical protein